MSPRSKKDISKPSTSVIAMPLANKNSNPSTILRTLGLPPQTRHRVLKNLKGSQNKNQEAWTLSFLLSPQILKPLKKIWLAANLPCSKRLKIILPSGSLAISNPSARLPSSWPYSLIPHLPAHRPLLSPTAPL